ncbi:uncharacterized protein LOC105835596 [Monomorium pharaonis]|uniref:uncharacterized protein LOC105835596 n=1 Tax=Monomorium pharaonis TaxID=307658 RepID=UPI00063F3B1B|nr:uncharacterized protein LOC105835596 [Monomorium pharaonis]
MKILVFTACILAAITVGDAQIIDNIINTFKTFDIKELIRFHLTFAKCVLKLGLSKIAKPEISYCIAEEKNLIDKEEGLKWDETLIYLEKLIRNETKIDEIKKVLLKCQEEGDKFEGNKYEQTIKSLECGLSTVKSILKQTISSENKI